MFFQYTIFCESCTMHCYSTLDIFLIIIFKYIIFMPYETTALMLKLHEVELDWVVTSDIVCPLFNMIREDDWVKKKFVYIETFISPFLYCFFNNNT